MNKEVVYVNDQVRGDEISLGGLIQKIKRAFSYLQSKWPLVLGIAILGGIVGITYATIKRPVYHATSTFVLEEGEKSSGLAQYAGLASMAGINLGGGGLFEADNILELYRSRTMIRRALLASIPYHNKTKQLIELYLESTGLNKKWKDDPQLRTISFNDPSKFTLTHDSLLNGIITDINKNNLVVGKSDKSQGIFQVQVNSESQFFAKGFADEIVKTVNNFYVATKSKKSKDNLDNLQHQTDSVRAVINHTMYSSAAILDATPNLNPVRQRLRVPLESARTSAETNKLILAELVKNLELAKMSLRRESPLIQVIDEPVLPLDKSSTGKVLGLFAGSFLFLFLISFLLLVIRLFKAESTG